MRGLIVGDCHFCDYTPIKRTDNLIEAQFRKIDRIHTISEELACDAVFLLGDVFDKARPEIWLVNRVIKSFNQFSCSIFSLTGNHDLQGCRDGISGTALGTLFSTGTFQQIEGDLEILGIPFRALNHTREHTTSLYVTEVPSIVLTHNMVTPQVAPFSHVFAKDILKVAKNNFIFAGDFHDPFEDYNPQTNSRIVNPGVLTRTSIAEKEIDPSVIFFEATPEHLVTSYRKISLGQPRGETIFNVSQHEYEKQEELNLKQFIESIKQTQFSSHDIEQLVQDIGRERQLDERIIAEAVSRIKIAKTITI